MFVELYGEKLCKQFTLCMYEREGDMCHGELLQEYDAVILLTLRDPKIQAAKHIKDCYFIQTMTSGLM